MTAHAIRQNAGKGAKCGQMVRIMVSLPPADMRRMTWLAQKRNVPVANVLRDAVWAYMLPIASDADRDASREAKAPLCGDAPNLHLQSESNT